MRKYSLCNDPAQRDSYADRDQARRQWPWWLDLACRQHQGRRRMDRSRRPTTPSRCRSVAIISSSSPAASASRPFIAMIHALKHDPAKKYKLYYCSRTPEMTAFREELSAPEFKGKVIIHHDDGDPAKALDLWPIVEERRNREHLYCCGPRGLMQAVRDMTGHWSSAAIHFEAFSDADARRPDDTAVQRQARQPAKSSRCRSAPPSSKRCARKVMTCQAPAKAAPAAPAAPNFSPAKPIIAIWC